MPQFVWDRWYRGINGDCTSDCGTEVPGMRLAGAWRGVSGWRLPHILSFTRPNMNNLKIQKKKITPKKQLLMKTRRERFTQVELRTSERARTLQRFWQRTLYDAKQTKRNNATREKAQAERINRMRRKRIVRAERRDEANKKAKKASDDFFYATRVKQSPDLHPRRTWKDNHLGARENNLVKR